jgi:2-amino-4-hydroxy-6-hydroxymethyldihydropteridine diphosphokinase
MAVVFLALGSNVGDSERYITQAIALLGREIVGLELASTYTSKAVGYTDQPDFVNTAIRGATTLKPLELLKFIKEIEAKIGRVSRFRWGPREIDIDIIFYDDMTLDTPVLTIPHPRFAERDFVLRPLCDIDPDAVDPVSKRSVQQLLEALSPLELAILKQQ